MPNRQNAAVRVLTRWLIPVVHGVCLAAGCSVQESTRSGGLIAPASTSVAPVVTVTASSAVAAAVAVAETVEVRFDAPADTSTTSLATEISGSTNGNGSASAGASADSGSLDTANADTTRANDSETTTNAVVTTAADASGKQDDASPDAWALQVLDTIEPPSGFDEGLLRVESPSRTTFWPVVVASTPQSRSAGLMSVEDFDALGGYAAMAFVFDGDTTGAFWMRNTPLPLRITFITVDGEVVSGTDMVPCLPPTPAGDCERYYADGPYRIAIEHPLDPSFDLGLGSAASVTLAR